MSGRRKSLRPLNAIWFVAVSIGCGGGERQRQTHTVAFDVGGAVAYVGDPSEPLAGVEVTLIDTVGTTFVATSSSYGLWALSDLAPGPYFEQFRFAGYEDVTRQFTLEAFGESDVANPFVGRPPALMEETRLRALAEPFSAEITHGDDLVDGVAGDVLRYRVAVDGDIVLTFNQPIVTGFAFLEDGVTGDITTGILDTSSSATMRFPEADIEAMNGGAGLFVDSDPSTRHYLFVQAGAYTPVHGDPLTLEASVRFNAVP